MTVDLSITGTATPTLDYRVNGTVPIVIPAGQLSAQVSIVPVPSPNVYEPTEDVVIEIANVITAWKMALKSRPSPLRTMIRQLL